MLSAIVAAGLAAIGSVLAEGVEQQADRDHRDEDGAADDADRNVALGERQRFAAAGLALAVGGERRADAARRSGR